MNPFIIDIEKALSKVSEHPKEQYYLIFSIAILLEILSLLVFGVFIYKSWKNRYWKVICNLTKQYRDLVVKAKKHNLLPIAEKEIRDDLYNWDSWNDLQNYAVKTHNILMKIIKWALSHIEEKDDYLKEWKFDSQLIQSYLADTIPTFYTSDKKLAPNEIGSNNINNINYDLTKVINKIMISKSKWISQSKDDVKSIVLEASVKNSINLWNLKKEV